MLGSYSAVVDTSNNRALSVRYAGTKEFGSESIPSVAMDSPVVVTRGK